MGSIYSRDGKYRECIPRIVKVTVLNYICLTGSSSSEGEKIQKDIYMSFQLEFKLNLIKNAIKWLSNADLLCKRSSALKTLFKILFKYKSEMCIYTCKIGSYL